MSIAALNWAWTQDCPSAPAKLVLLALADKANDDGECWPGMETVAGMAGVSVRQVSTHLAKLEDVGLIERRRRRTWLGHLGKYTFHLCIPSGRKLPVDQEKSTSGSEPPVEESRQWKPDVATTGSELPHKKHPPEEPTTSSPDVPSDPEVSETARRLTRQLAVKVKANGFKVPAKGRKSHRDWLVAMDRLLRIDKADPDEVAQVIDWSTDHEFWQANVRSATKFREQYPSLRLRMANERKQPADRGIGTGGVA